MDANGNIKHYNGSKDNVVIYSTGNRKSFTSIVSGSDLGLLLNSKAIKKWMPDNVRSISNPLSAKNEMLLAFVIIDSEGVWYRYGDKDQKHMLSKYLNTDYLADDINECTYTECLWRHYQTEYDIVKNDTTLTQAQQMSKGHSINKKQVRLYNPSYARSTAWSFINEPEIWEQYKVDRPTLYANVLAKDKKARPEYYASQA